MKSFNTNFVPQNIVLNAQIFYSFNEEKDLIFVKIPTIRDSISDHNFNLFLSLLFLKVKDYKKMRLKMQIGTPTEGFIALLRESKEIREQVQPYIQKYLVGSEVSVSGISIGERILTAQEVEYFIEIILVSFGVKEYEEKKEIDADLSKMSPTERKIYERQKATLEKLEAAKKRKQQAQTKDGQIDLPKIIAGVMKEFNLSLEEIKDLNYYTLYYLFSYVFKIDHYDFIKQAAASGNLAKKSKITHWLE